MKILIIIGGFFPGEKCGGPPVSVDNFCSLMHEHECYIVTVNHDLNDNKPYESIQDGWNNRCNCKVLYLEDCNYNKKKFEEIIHELNPDILYLQGLFQSCIFPCLIIAKKLGVNVLLAPRGELCAGAFKRKWYKKIPYTRVIKLLGLVDNIHFQATSNEEYDAIQTIFRTDEKRIHFLDNVPSIPNGKISRNQKEPGVGRFVFLSRIHPKKNLLGAICLFRNITKAAFFDIYGPIEDSQYWNECTNAIRNLPRNIIVEYKGLLKHENVHKTLSQYDALLFPTYSENYGHVIAESLAVGTPVIISDQTPWNGVNDSGAGWALSLSDKKGFIAAINSIIDDSDNKREQNSKDYFTRKTHLNELHDKYEETLRYICGDLDI